MSHDHDHPHDHAHDKWKHDGVKVIPGNSLDPNTAQTPGMDRKAAINFGAPRKIACPSAPCESAALTA